MKKTKYTDTRVMTELLAFLLRYFIISKADLWREKKSDSKREEKILHPLDQSSKGHNGQDWGRPKLGAWDPTLVSHVSYKGLSTSFPDAIPGSWVANGSPGTRKCIHKDCSSRRQLLTMSSSCHNQALIV